MRTGFLTIYWRDMLRFVRFRALLFSSLVQPALWLAFFGIAMSNNFERLTATMPVIPGVRTVGYLTFIGAGVIAMTTLFTSLFGGTVLLFDKTGGLCVKHSQAHSQGFMSLSGIGLSGHDQVVYPGSCNYGVRSFGLELSFSEAIPRYRSFTLW